ncbi:hypothetical protein Trydic_g20792 [Trypoxylus dichotomus]
MRPSSLAVVIFVAQCNSAREIEIQVYTDHLVVIIRGREDVIINRQKPVIHKKRDGRYDSLNSFDEKHHFAMNVNYPRNISDKSLFWDPHQNVVVYLYTCKSLREDLEIMPQNDVLATCDRSMVAYGAIDGRRSSR